MVIHRLKDVLKSARESGITLTLNSTLSLLSDNKVALLKELGIKSILTSLMAHNPEVHDYLAQRSGSFERRVKGIEKATSAGFNVAVNMAVMKQNIDLIDETAFLSANLGTKAFCATKMLALTNSPDFSEFKLDQEELPLMFERLYSAGQRYNLVTDSLEHYPACVFTSEETRGLYGRRNCSAGKTACTIGFDGGVRPCSHAHLSYGNISSGLHQAWVNMGKWRTGELVSSECKNCSAFPKTCGGGCRIEAYTSNGNLAKNDPYCKHKPPKVPLKVVEIDEALTGAKFRLAHRTRMREEEFGSIMFFSSSNWLMCDKQLTELLLSSEEGAYIDTGTISKLYGCSASDALTTISLLFSRKLVVRVD